VTPAEASTPTDPADAVAQLVDTSPEMRGCAILDAQGAVLAATGEDDDEAWREAAAELIAAADAAGGEAAAYAHIASGDGEVFLVRHGGLVAVAAAERFVLSSLVVFDLRATLRELEAAGFS
jgi:predicted regulator of Ras-like GTPase activity (Roadblock/LC7/MglB family)